MDAEAFISLVEIGVDFSMQWRLVDESATAINRGGPAKRGVRAFAVIMVPPFLKLLFESVGLWLDPRPELFQCGALGALDFAVKLRRPRFVGPKLDSRSKSRRRTLVEQFAAAIGLNPPDREGRLLDDLIQEMQGIRPSAASEQPDHDIAAAIIHRGALITARPDLATSIRTRPPGIGRL